VAGIPVPHYYYLLESRDPAVLKATIIPERKLLSSSTSGRSVAVGQLFEDSMFPDIVHGLVDGNVLLFANLGLDESTNEFLGFKFQGGLQVKSGCTIFDVRIASLAPCTVSIVCAVTCGTDNSAGTKNEIFTKPFNTTACTQDATLDASNSTVPEEDPLTVSADVEPIDSSIMTNYTTDSTQGDTVLDTSNGTLLEEDPLTVSTDVEPINSSMSNFTNNATQEEDPAMDASIGTLPEEDALTVITDVEPINSGSSSSSTSSESNTTTHEEHTVLDASDNGSLPDEEEEEDALPVSDAQPTNDSNNGISMSNLTTGTTAGVRPSEFLTPSTTLPRSKSSENSARICSLFRYLRGCGS
jgi:hypothetical protein